MQPVLFAEEELPRAVADTAAVRARLEEILAKTQAAASRPWKASTVANYRESVWPALLVKLSDPEEAARLSTRIEA